jgi:hypothetical protein
MSTQYKENNFSAENLPSLDATSQKNINTKRPNIDHLIKRIINERRQRKKTNIISLGTALLSFTLIFYFFQN